MTLTELHDVVQANPADWSARLTLSIATNTEGWVTWLAVQADVAQETARKRREARETHQTCSGRVAA